MQYCQIGRSKQTGRWLVYEDEGQRAVLVSSSVNTYTRAVPFVRYALFKVDGGMVIAILINAL